MYFLKGKNYMFFKSIINVLNSTYNVTDNNRIDKADPNLVRYFRTEYGIDWKVALEHHLYKESIKNDKKAA